MDREDGSKPAERFLPKGTPNLQGALEKMNYLCAHTHIRIGVPLRQQIYSLLSSPTAQQQMGLTVQEVAQELSLNSKTCAKVLDRMITRCENVRATAHRYGRVYQYKYYVFKAESREDADLIEDDDEYVKSLNSDLYCTLKAIDLETQAKCRKALLISLSDKKHGSRIRVTHQNFIRSLFIMHKIRAKRVVSIFELKEAIKDELEPSIQWSLDKKTVLRIVWKLQRLGLIRQMCFRVVIRRHSEQVVDYLGDDYDCIREDKKRLSAKAEVKGNMVLYKVLVTLPDVFERDHEVLDYPSLQNPTRKKQDKPRPPSLSTHIRSKLLKTSIALANDRVKAVKLRNGLEMLRDTAEVLVAMKEEEGKKAEEGDKNGASGEQEELLKQAQRLFVMAHFVKDMLRKQVNNRYSALFVRIRTSPEITALKCLLNRPSISDSSDEITRYIAAHSLNTPQQLALKLDTSCIPEEQLSTSHDSIVPPETKMTFKEAYSACKKLLLWLALHPCARSLDAFSSQMKLDSNHTTAILQRLLSLELVLRDAEGKLRLSKRCLPM